MIVAATGHRPKRLGGDNPFIIANLRQLALSFLEKTNPEEFISGMAQGWDTVTALAALELGIPLTAAVPFPSQSALWPIEDRILYNRILAKAAKVCVISKGYYTIAKMHIRNKWMVDHCDELLPLWDGYSRFGGTYNCVKYATEKEKPYTNLWSAFVKLR